MKNAAYRYRVGKQSGDLSHVPVVVNSFKFSRVEKRVPIGHVDSSFFQLRSCVFEFGEEPSGAKVMVILVDLSQCVANL